jgi:hypothetical protein
MAGKIIDAGPSARGWSRIGTFKRCPRLFWTTYVDPARRTGDIPFPLARGILGHAGLAQWFARLGCVQAGRDPNEYGTPNEGMEYTAQRMIQGGASQSRVLDAFDAALSAMEAHAKHHPYTAETMRVRAVEFLIDTEFHGFPYTARLDLVMEDARGSIWVIDHKIVGRIEDKTFTRYSLSGQFLGIGWLAERKWGSKFAGVMLNAAASRGGAAVRRQIEPAPFALKRFPEEVARAERQILGLGEDEGEWPMALHEQVCTSAYGPCDQYERCRWGVSR